ncbi:MAG: hypothetical protein KBE91_04175 [Bacteroidia bacterium]|nr:hypothetical protein [Bacteroidia bacterium]MBP9688784.1 hypothetical protein [Bacteroidia bacterium]
MIRLATFIVCVFTVNFCKAQSLPKKYAAITNGTSEVDVIKAVGEPKKIESFSTVKYNTYDTSYYWRYDGEITIIFTNHAVETVEPKWENVLKRIQQRANKKEENGLIIINND